MQNNKLLSGDGKTLYTGQGETVESTARLGLNKYKMIAAEKLNSRLAFNTQRGSMKPESR